MSQVRQIALPAKTLPDNGTVDFRLPTADVILGCKLLLTVTFTSGAGTPVESEDGPSAYIKTVSLRPSTSAQIHAATPGPMLQLIAEVDRGGPIPVATLDAVASSSGTYQLVLPIHLGGLGISNPMAIAFDPRGNKGEVILSIDTRAFDGIVTGTTESISAATIQPFLDVLSGADSEIELTAQRRFVTTYRTITGAGPLEAIPLKRKGVIRRIYGVCRTAAPLTGVRSNGILSDMTIRRNVGDDILRETHFLIAHDSVQERRDFTPVTGFFVIDLDYHNSLAAQGLIAAQGAGLESLDLLLTALGAGHLTLTTEYLVGLTG